MGYFAWKRLVARLQRMGLADNLELIAPSRSAQLSGLSHAVLALSPSLNKMVVQRPIAISPKYGASPDNDLCPRAPSPHWAERELLCLHRRL